MDTLIVGIFFLELLVAAALVTVLLRHRRGHAASAILMSASNISELSEFSPDGLVLVDVNGKILKANAQMQELFGYAPAQLMGKSIECLFPQELKLNLGDLQLNTRRARQLLMGLDGLGEGLRARRSDGSLFGVEITVNQGENELEEYFAIAIRDISDRIQVALSILEATPNAIFAYDLQSMKFIYANKGAQRQLGFETKQLLQMDPLAILEMESHDPFREHFQRIACGDDDSRMRSYLYKTADGGNVTAEVSMHYVDHSANSYIISIGRDISARINALNAVEMKSLELQDVNRQLERERENLEIQVRERTRQIEQERKLAEQANRAKSNFLASMSHEIRTPMNGVVSMIELLQNSSLDHEQRAKINTIQDSAQSLLSIIDEILDFSKVEAGRIELARDAVNLPELAESVYNSLLAIAESKQVVLNYYLDPGLTRVILSDVVRLRQILVNIVGNAIKFSSGLDRTGQVSLRLEASGENQLRIQVEDNGVGIAKDSLDSIFEPFEQEDGSTLQRFGGTGLGLPITKALVEKMNGSIRVSSLQNVRTCFSIDLPITAADEQPQADSATLVDTLCVLMASDDRRRANWRDWLVMQGADVVCISDWENLMTTLQLQSDGQYKLVGIVLDAEPREDIKASINHELNRRNLDKFVLLQSGQSDIDADLDPWHRVDDAPNENRNFERVLAILAGESTQPEIMDAVEADFLPTDYDESDPAADSLNETAGEIENQIKVLVAEDNPINQSVIGSQLEALGFSSTLVSDGLEALEAWKRREHVLLLTDLHMPNMDGYTLAREIRRREQESERTPIIAYTANAVKGERDRCLDCGMDDYLTKPIALKELESKISSWAQEAKIAVAERGEELGLGDELDEAMGAHKTLDVEVLKKLIGDKPELVERLLRTYQDSLMSSYPKIVDAYDANNWDDIESIAHTLKSSSRSVGALPLGELFAALEEAGRNRNMAVLASSMVRLGEAVDAVQQQLLIKLGAAQASEIPESRMQP